MEKKEIIKATIFSILFPVYGTSPHSGQKDGKKGETF
jgi:hypothetical protein